MSIIFGMYPLKASIATGLPVGYHSRLCYPFWIDKRGRKNMYVPDKVIKSVVFIGIDDNGAFVPKATGFIATIKEDEYHFQHIVTAEHVISGLQLKGHDNISIRLNLVSG